MQIHIRLHGALRDKLPANAKGQAILEFEEGAAVTAVLSHLSLRGHLQVAVNQEIVDNWNILLHDGDWVEVFRPTAGGSP
ncbi:MAG: MoaD/ThiS family protein [Chloroflexi bacterium]|nr:MoaD/ThiS family protein [Chloroflexota bacterium]